MKKKKNRNLNMIRKVRKLYREDNPSNNIEFLQAKPYHEVIKDINGFVEKHINDPRSNDRFFERQDLMKDFIDLFNQNKDLWRSNDPMNRMLVYLQGVQLVANLLIQLSLFHRPIMITTHYVDGNPVDLPVFPKGVVPFNHQETDPQGNTKDYSDTHSLKLMEYYYKKLNKSIDQLMKS